MTETNQQLLTLGQVAGRLRVPVHVARYAIERFPVAPTARAGILRLWSESQLPEIHRSLAAVRFHERSTTTHL